MTAQGISEVNLEIVKVTIVRKLNEIQKSIVSSFVHKKKQRVISLKHITLNLRRTYFLLILADDSNLIACMLSVVLSSYMAMGSILISGGRFCGDRMPTFCVV